MAEKWIPQPELGDRIEKARYEKGASEGNKDAKGNPKGYSRGYVGRLIAKARGATDAETKKIINRVSSVLSVLERGQKPDYKRTDESEYLPEIEEALGISLRAVSSEQSNVVKLVPTLPPPLDIAHVSPAVRSLGQFPVYHTTPHRTGNIVVDMLTPEYVAARPWNPLPKGAFGLRISSRAMEPVYRPGDTVWIDPDTEAQLGDNCVFFPLDYKTNAMRCIRCWEGVTEEEWIVRQYNPDTTHTLLKADWPIVNKIDGMRSR